MRRMRRIIIVIMMTRVSETRPGIIFLNQLVHLPFPNLVMMIMMVKIVMIIMKIVMIMMKFLVTMMKIVMIMMIMKMTSFEFA